MPYLNKGKFKELIQYFNDSNGLIFFFLPVRTTLLKHPYCWFFGSFLFICLRVFNHRIYFFEVFSICSLDMPSSATWTYLAFTPWHTTHWPIMRCTLAVTLPPSIGSIYEITSFKHTIYSLLKKWRRAIVWFVQRGTIWGNAIKVERIYV